MAARIPAEPSLTFVRPTGRCRARYIGSERPMKTEVIPDPLQQGLDLPLKGAFYPLGFPLEVETNSADVLRGLEESFSGFQPMFPRPPLRLHVAVSEHES